MYRDAVRQYKKALVLEPKNAQAKNWLAYTYKRAGDLSEALRIYEDSLRLTPNNIVACYELGVIYAMGKDYENAKKCFAKASSMSELDAVTGNEEYEYYTAN